MKNTTSPVVRLLNSIAFLVLVIAISSCSKKVTFNNSAVVPAAQGSIKISKDDNSNHKIDIVIEQLADPERLTPPKKVYVVWMESKNRAIVNLGRLISESGFFSSSRKAEMHAVTPFKPTRVFITAEDDAGIPYPGSTIVLTTETF